VAESISKEKLAGSVVRIGKQWSIIRSNTDQGLVVWGRITDEGGKVETLEDYTAAE
jgi:hypothetical protein